MYADVVLGVPPAVRGPADGAEEGARRQRDTELPADDLRSWLRRLQGDRPRAQCGERFPDDPEAQLWGAIEAVFRSWNVERAVAYRRVHGVPDYLGTAVSVQAMVFGNMGNDCGTGVAFTRDPSTGERKFFGEFLLNAQGEDVVAGIRTPLDIDEMAGCCRTRTSS
jgi:pyruvate, orthophosphate dikinase